MSVPKFSRGVDPERLGPRTAKSGDILPLNPVLQCLVLSIYGSCRADHTSRSRRLAMVFPRPRYGNWLYANVLYERQVCGSCV